MNFRQVIKVIYSNHILVNSVRKNINPFKFRLIDITISTCKVKQNKDIHRSVRHKHKYKHKTTSISYGKTKARERGKFILQVCYFAYAYVASEED